MAEPRQRPNDTQHSASEIIAMAVRDSEERARAAAMNARPSDPVPRERTVWASLCLAVPLLIGVLAVNVYGLSVTSLFETPPSPTAARQEAQRTLDGLVADVEEFWKDYNELPESLVEIGVPARGHWSYSMGAGNTYRLRGTLYGQAVSFDSPQPRERRMVEEPDRR
jgi:hypothetical protein